MIRLKFQNKPMVGDGNKLGNNYFLTWGTFIYTNTKCLSACKSPLLYYSRFHSVQIIFFVSFAFCLMDNEYGHFSLFIWIIMCYVLSLLNNWWCTNFIYLFPVFDMLIVWFSTLYRSNLFKNISAEMDLLCVALSDCEKFEGTYSSGTSGRYYHSTVRFDALQ